jgi:hypothetical protein
MKYVIGTVLDFNPVDDCPLWLALIHEHRIYHTGIHSKVVRLTVTNSSPFMVAL